MAPSLNMMYVIAVEKRLKTFVFNTCILKMKNTNTFLRINKTKTVSCVRVRRTRKVTGVRSGWI